MADLWACSWCGKTAEGWWTWTQADGRTTPHSLCPSCSHEFLSDHAKASVAVRRAKRDERDAAIQAVLDGDDWKITQRAIAEQVGCSVGTVADAFKRGAVQRHRPDPGRIEALLAAVRASFVPSR